MRRIFRVVFLNFQLKLTSESQYQYTGLREGLQSIFIYMYIYIYAICMYVCLYAFHTYVIIESFLSSYGSWFQDPLT